MYKVGQTSLTLVQRWTNFTIICCNICLKKVITNLKEGGRRSIREILGVRHSSNIFKVDCFLAQGQMQRYCLVHISEYIIRPNLEYAFLSILSFYRNINKKYVVMYPWFCPSCSIPEAPYLENMYLQEAPVSHIFGFSCFIRYYLLNMLKIKCDINQQYLKTDDLHFVKSE